MAVSYTHLDVYKRQALPDIEDIAVTASIGVAAGVPGMEQRPDVLVAHADHALYVAKAAGRNRVELASD